MRPYGEHQMIGGEMYEVVAVTEALAVQPIGADPPDCGVRIKAELGRRHVRWSRLDRNRSVLRPFLDVVPPLLDAVVYSEVEPGRFHHDIQLVRSLLYPLEEATDIRDIGRHALVAYELAIIIQNAGLSVLFR